MFRDWRDDAICVLIAVCIFCIGVGVGRRVCKEEIKECDFICTEVYQNIGTEDVPEWDLLVHVDGPMDWSGMFGPDVTLRVVNTLNGGDRNDGTKIIHL